MSVKPLHLILCAVLSALMLAAAQSSHAGVALDLRYGLPRDFEENVSQLAMEDPVILHDASIPLEEMAGVWARAFAKLGYDYDATVWQAVQKADSAECERLRASGGLAYIVPVISGLKAGRWSYMVDSGWISHRTAGAVLSFALACDLVTRGEEIAPKQELPEESAPAETPVRAQTSGTRKICGTVTRLSATTSAAAGPAQAGETAHIWLADDDADLGEYIFSGSAPSCTRLAVEGQPICVVVEAGEDEEPATWAEPGPTDEDEAAQADGEPEIVAAGPAEEEEPAAADGQDEAGQNAAGQEESAREAAPNEAEHAAAPEPARPARRVLSCTESF
ncbi:MAG: hypothetical protein Q4F72_06530 [Desulfovibrionaceae bacterium]|nr:hypothetical protein [Desulfovibrionaceae bacterium]